MESPREIQLNKPEPFNPNKNSTSLDWRLWKKNFLIYLELTEARLKLSERGLAYLLLNLMGPVGIEAKENMTFDDLNEEENMNILLKKFDEIFDPPLNEIEERYKFFSRRKFDTETVENYVACIKEQAANCNFGKQTEKFILDMVVLSMDYYLQQHIFLIKDLSLPVAIKLYEKYLINEKKLRNICDANNDKLLHTDDLTDSKYKANDDFSQNIKEQESKAENTKDQINTKEKLLNLLLNNSNENDDKEKTTKISYTLENCQWCGSEHPVEQCPHNKNCWGCKDFPHNICFHCKKNPHDDNCSYKKLILPKNDMLKGPVCSKCSTNHLSSADCPAQHVVCQNCFTPGHYTNVCEKKALNTNYQEKVQEKLKPSYIEVENCLWCESYHKPYELCRHNWMCRNCDDFPHNVCFYCKNNPHIDFCTFKKVITLPTKLASKNNFSQPKMKVCATCFEAGHGSEECNKVQSNFDRQQSSKCRADQQNQSRAVNVCPTCGTNHRLNDCPARNKQYATKRVCFRCNTQHPPRQCPAYNVTCSNCHKLGHFDQVCKSKKIQESASYCPMCNKCLKHYNDEYDYCTYCKVHVKKEELDDSWEDISSDSSNTVETENRQPSRRHRRRQRRNRQPKDDGPCSIS